MNRSPFLPPGGLDREQSTYLKVVCHNFSVILFHIHRRECFKFHILIPSFHAKICIFFLSLLLFIPSLWKKTWGVWERLRFYWLVGASEDGLIHLSMKVDDCISTCAPGIPHRIRPVASLARKAGETWVFIILLFWKWFEFRYSFFRHWSLFSFTNMSDKLILHRSSQK